MGARLIGYKFRPPTANRVQRASSPTSPGSAPCPHHKAFDRLHRPGPEGVAGQRRALSSCQHFIDFVTTSFAVMYLLAT